MSFDKKKLIKKLIEVKEDLFQLIEKNYEEIDNLQEEIRRLEQRRKEIDNLIGIDNILDAESFLEQTNEDTITNVDTHRMIFSQKDPNLPLVKISYDGSKLTIEFPHPEKLQLQQQSSSYIEKILMPLTPLKEKEKDMEVVVDKQNDLGFVSKILINNLYKVENIDEIYKVFRDFVEHK